MWIRRGAAVVHVLRLRVPVVHLMEQFAAPSTLSVQRLPKGFSQRYMPLSGPRRHISFRSVGEQWLTTRVQPSTEDRASCGQDPGPDEKRDGRQEHGPPGPR
jgi:hypothetical protein